ncbi:Hint domain-containing protein [Frigidibacter sp. RF13]|uniref:Hint domain-containing protein n=1 Tax=Frigidibacter sp. RF13 TaxID=2997340 RepID=UPI002271C738|nr:Hint domain-containing protein [Frigidibacter sp. RF13]MCY1125294.1 Hint domain-containing protein [Frigidibacter sp. RF13]
MNFDLMRFTTENISPASTRPITAPPTAPVGPADRKDSVWSLPGLCWNANVMTSFGALPVQVLRQHDPLRLDDGQIRRIAWIDKVQLDEGFLASFPDAQPILIRAGALGPGLPARDMTVSPAQKVQSRMMNFSTEVRAARELIGRPGVMRKPETIVTYYLFHCGQPACVQAEGVTLQTAP